MLREVLQSNVLATDTLKGNYCKEAITTTCSRCHKIQVYQKLHTNDVNRHNYNSPREYISLAAWERRQTISCPVSGQKPDSNKTNRGSQTLRADGHTSSSSKILRGGGVEVRKPGEVYVMQLAMEFKTTFPHKLFLGNTLQEAVVQRKCCHFSLNCNSANSNHHSRAI